MDDPDPFAPAYEVMPVPCLECGRVVVVLEPESHQPWRCAPCAGTEYASPATAERSQTQWE